MSGDIPILFTGAMVLAHLNGSKTMTRRLLSPRYIRFSAYDQPTFRPLKDLLACALTDMQELRCLEPAIWTWLAKAFPHQNADVTRWLALLNPEPGTRMWVRERTTITAARDGEIKVSYDADGAAPDVWYPFPDRLKQKPVIGQRLSMGCYREISRLTDVVTAIKIERAQDISEADAVLEGITYENVIVGSHGSTGVHVEITADRYFNGAEDSEFEGHESGAEAFEDLWARLHGHESWAANPFVVAISYAVTKANIDALDAGATS